MPVQRSIDLPHLPDGYLRYMGLGSRGRILAVGCTVAAIAATVVYSLTASVASDIGVFGSPDLVTRAPPGARVVGSFRLCNTSENSIVPAVLYTSCGCLKREFRPAVVGPGETFEFVLRAKISDFGARAQYTYRVGVRDRPGEVSLSWTLVPDDREFLIAAPADVRAVSDMGRLSRFVLDVSYRCAGATYDPREDLSLECRSVAVVSTEIGLVRVHKNEDGFSGRVEFSIGWESERHPQDLSVELMCRGGMGRPITVTWPDE